MSNVDVVRSYADAWNAHAAEAVAGHFTRGGVRHWQVVANPLVGGLTRFQGRDEIASGVKGFMDALPDLVLSAETMVETADGAILEWRVRGTHTGAWGGWTGQGEEIDLRGVSVYRMDDGKIAEERLYFDPDMMVRNWAPQDAHRRTVVHERRISEHRPEPSLPPVEEARIGGASPDDATSTGIRVLRHPDARVVVTEVGEGIREVRVEDHDPELFVPISSRRTAYELPLIARILSVKGPAWLCDEISREEDPTFLQQSLRYSMLSYLPAAAFEGARLLDFGCGSGASTMVLARMFPKTRIVGIDLDESSLAVGRARAEHYAAANVSFHLSPTGDRLPPDLGRFDFISLYAVFEHLLPGERARLMPLLWSHLKPGGVFFVSATPHRWWPVEAHTTGIPLLNYLPDALALRLARATSKRIDRRSSWTDLLRNGVRGGTDGEIARAIDQTGSSAVRLAPIELGGRDDVDLWYALSTARRRSALKPPLRATLRAVKALSGRELVPEITMALRKAPT